MVLTCYAELENKRDFFNQKTIDTIQEFENSYKELNSSDENSIYVFRGVNEAKYKLYTSAQREWITKEWCKRGGSFSDFIDSILLKLRENPILKDYFHSLGVKMNDLLLLSLLQHYSAPSPLLDFTTDKDMAIFFGLDNISINQKGAEDGHIDNYLSLYMLKISRSSHRGFLPIADKFFNDAIENGEKKAQEFEQKKGEKMDKSNIRDIDKLTRWGCLLSGYGLMYIPNPLDSKTVKTITKEKLYFSNLNVIAQKGCFILNSDDKKSLEEKIFEKNVNSQDVITCLDIHKSLADCIRKKYLRDLDRDIVFPDFYKIAQDAYDTFRKGY